MSTLYRHHRPRAGLLDCLREGFTARRLEGYCQTPRHLFFLVWEGGVLEALDRADPHQGRTPVPPGASAEDLNQVYEARFFNKDGELRWLRDPEAADTGTAAWVSEAETAPPGFAPLPGDPPDAFKHLTFRDTVIIAQERAVLPGIPPGTRGCYVLREYFGPAPGMAGEDGNQRLVESRLLRIKPWTEAPHHD